MTVNSAFISVCVYRGRVSDDVKAVNILGCVILMQGWIIGC